MRSCDTVVHENEGHYPELRERQAYITKVIRVEEENFAKTIDGGMKIFDRAAGRAQGKGGDHLLRRRRLQAVRYLRLPHRPDHRNGGGRRHDAGPAPPSIRQMEEQQTRARKAREALGDLGWAGVEFGKDIPSTEFVGYDRDTVEDAKVVALVVEDELAEELMHRRGRPSWCWTRRPSTRKWAARWPTTASSPDGGAKFEVNNVQKNKGGKFMHYGKVVSRRRSKVGETVTASIDAERRKGVLPCPQRHPPAGRGPEDGAGRPCASGRLSGGA